jgi:hypothetical protein
MSEVVAFSSEQILAMWAHAYRLRRAAFACVAGAVLASAAALVLDKRGALGCGVLVLLLGVAAALFARRARWHERLSVQRLERLGGVPLPERTPSAEEIERLIKRTERKPYRWVRTWRP